jgi:TetR/AcrR family acrAB operon transcriptional repressor
VTVSQTRPRRTQTERREEAEAKLIEAAIKLVAQTGYDSFSLAELGDHAGFSRGLPGHYFGKKEDMLSAVVQQICDTLSRGVLDDQKIGRGLAGVENAIRLYLRGPQDHPTAVKALHVILGASLTRPELRENVQRLTRRGLTFFADQIRYGIEKGEIRPDADAESCAAAIFAFLRGTVFTHWIDADFDLKQVGEQFITVFVGSLRSLRTGPV